MEMTLRPAPEGLCENRHRPGGPRARECDNESRCPKRRWSSTPTTRCASWPRAALERRLTRSAASGPGRGPTMPRRAYPRRCRVAVSRERVYGLAARHRDWGPRALTHSKDVIEELKG